MKSFPSASMRAATFGMLLVGAGVFIALVLATGVGAIRDALAPIGWGFVPIIAVHAVPIFLDVVAWRLLIPGTAPSLAALFAARWIGEAANNLLPVPQIGGDLVRLRVAMIAGTRMAHATASVVADVTLGAITQIVFALAGIVILIAVYDEQSIVPALAGLLLFASGVLIFYLAQRGRFLTSAWSRIATSQLAPPWVARLGSIEPFHGVLDAIYTNRPKVARACVWRLAGWIAGAGEIFLSLHFLGYPARWMEAFVLESLSQAGRSAAFAVPGGLGAQEASFLAVGVMLGLDPSTCLALALIRRGRDIALGIPGLAAYWLVEVRRSVPAD